MTEAVQRHPWILEAYMEKHDKLESNPHEFTFWSYEINGGEF